MNILERVIEGIENGVMRHWRYTKNLLKIKPEYLLTISVADALTQGFDEIHGIDLEIKLEESAKRVFGSILMSSVGFDKYFKKEYRKFSSDVISIKENRMNGKVDIYCRDTSGSYELGNSWVIELKGFNPNGNEIKKEIIRLSAFLSANCVENKCVGCVLSFPSFGNYEKLLKKYLSSIIDNSKLSYEISSKFVETDENPEDGIPCYFVNCILISSNLK